MQTSRPRHLRLLLGGLLIASAGAGHAEPFIDIGFHGSEIKSDYADRDDTVETSDSGVHLGLGMRRSVSERSDIGFRLELDSIDSNLYFAIRAFDYRRRISERFAVNAFLGAARLDLATPAYGYYAGFGVQWLELVSDWDLSVDLRFGDKVARDNLLPEDPQGGSPDNFHDVTGISIYLSRRFGSSGNNR